jgi:putative transposase
MPDYKRWFRAGGTYFFTVVTYKRRKIFSDAHARTSLHQAIREVQDLRFFEVQGIVLLPDHCHCIWKMPEDDKNFSMRWGMIKRRFTKLWTNSRGHDITVSQSRRQRGERGIWQRRFWEHLIYDQQDYARHMDYIHYNPVKHGYIRCPHQFKHSSFYRWVKEGVYNADWLCQCEEIRKIPDFEAISHTVGE